MIDNKFNELQNDIMRDMSVINNKYEQLILDKDNKIKNLEDEIGVYESLFKDYEKSISEKEKKLLAWRMKF